MRPGKKAGTRNRTVARVMASVAIVAVAVLIGASFFGGSPTMRLADDIFWLLPSH